MRIAVDLLLFYCFTVGFIFLRKPADVALTWRVCLGVAFWPWTLVRGWIRYH